MLKQVTLALLCAVSFANASFVEKNASYKVTGSQNGLPLYSKISLGDDYKAVGKYLPLSVVRALGVETSNTIKNANEAIDIATTTLNADFVTAAEEHFKLATPIDGAAVLAKIKSVLNSERKQRYGMLVASFALPGIRAFLAGNNVQAARRTLWQKTKNLVTGNWFTIGTTAYQAKIDQEIGMKVGELAQKLKTSRLTTISSNPALSAELDAVITQYKESQLVAAPAKLLTASKNALIHNAPRSKQELVGLLRNVCLSGQKVAASGKLLLSKVSGKLFLD